MYSCSVQWILIWTLSGDVENSRNQGGYEQAHTYTRRVESLEGSRWWHRKILNFLPEAQWIYIYTRNNSYGTGPENWINRASTTNGKRTALRHIEEAEIQSCQGKKTRPVMVIHNQEVSQRNGFFPLEYSSSTPGAWSLRACTEEMSPPNSSPWKLMRNISRKTELQNYRDQTSCC